MNIETANRLLQYRKKSNYSQEELAEKIGVSRQAVSKWERAEASPDTDNLILLAEIYGVTLDELIKGEKSKTANDNAENAENADNTANDNETDDDVKYEKVEGFSFKNGIHVDRDGDHVHINIRDGVNVHDKHGSKVHVGWDGIHVEENGKKRVYTDENGNVMADEEVIKEHNAHHSSKPKGLKIWNKVPFWAIALIVFFVWGASGMYFGWALSWLAFLTIPLYYSLGDAIFKRNPHHFAYPVLAAMCYIIFGYFNICGGWGYGWIAFLTIPIYYIICGFFKKESE